jgi:signal transduction histidine kinase
VALIMTMPLVWRRRAPTVVLATALAGLGLVLAVAADPGGVPLSALITLIVCFYTVGAYAPSRRAVVGVALGVLGVSAIDGASSGAFQASGVRPSVWLLLAASWLVGREVRRRRIEVRALRQRAVALEVEREEQARVAVAEERARIARELHDVIAHSVTVIVVQAQAARRVLAGDEPHAHALLETIESTGRAALAELRRSLGLLRTHQEHASLEPQPSLQRVHALADQMREVGLPVDVVIEGQPAELPAGVDLSAYRIVQEGLTNALKHAGHAHARVLIRYAPGQLEIEVSDDGTGRVGDSGNGAGHGIVGMRERVALYGGHLETSRSGTGGYVLRARLPLGASA